MKLEKKQIEIIIVAVIFGSLAIVLVSQFVGFSGGTRPPGAAVESRESVRDRLIKAEIMANRLPQQRQEVAALEKELADRRASVPAEADHTWLSRQLSGAAAETGARDVSQRMVLTPPAAVDKEFEGAYALRGWEIRLRADYHDLGRFLSILEGLNRYIEVTDIVISGNEPEGQEIAFTVLYLARK
ncbi:MAG: type 4a pilus biogenesis protein PilO [bacterium]|nr:type 4a pilus biogenesis protein PilO [bacterium]